VIDTVARVLSDSAMFLFLVKLRLRYGCLMAVEPLPNIRDGVLGECADSCQA
jgi:hypothetical protein